MDKEFDVNTKIEFPLNTVTKTIDEFNIVIAPDYPNWIVLNAQESEIYNILQKNTIIDGLKEFYSVHSEYSEDECIRIFSDLLSKIEDCQFYKDSLSSDEEPVQNISKKIHINLTNDCNMRCSHCFVSAGLIPKHELNVENILSKINDIEKNNKISEIIISGGEPFKHPNIISLLYGIKQHHVILFTNGTFINEDNYQIVSECCNEVQISFEGVSENIYEKIRGKGNYSKALKAIELLKTTGIKITVAVTILPDTLKDLQENLITFINKINYNDLEVRINNKIELSGNAVNLDFSKYDQQESDKAAAALINILQKENICKIQPRIRNVKFKNCGIGTNIVIDSDGKIYPCSKFSSYFKKFSTSADDLVYEFNELNSKTSIDNIALCKSCELRYICSGGCRIENLNNTGKMTHPQCDAKFKEKQYRKLIFDSLIGK